jgi:hypothetical protein
MTFGDYAPVPLRRNRDFRILRAGQGISVLGSLRYWFASVLARFGTGLASVLGFGSVWFGWLAQLGGECG